MEISQYDITIATRNDITFGTDIHRDAHCDFKPETVSQKIGKPEPVSQKIGKLEPVSQKVPSEKSVVKTVQDEAHHTRADLMYHFQRQEKFAAAMMIMQERNEVSS